MNQRGTTRPCFPTSLVVFCSLAGLAMAQRTPDEINSIEVFKRAAAAVVHVRSMQVSSEDQGTVGEATGSGFLIDQAGHVLTNYHVVANSLQVKLVTAEGQAFGAILVGTAPAFDLALLRLDATGEILAGLSPLPLGESGTVEIGQKVLAIGNPFGFHNTLTTGIVSGLARDLPGAPVGLGEAFLQTDAAINPGNSGGPLLDSAGKVIGINAVIAAQGQNIGFAIPIGFVKKILPELMSMGHVYRPDLGLSLQAVIPGLASLLGLPTRTGLLVAEVVPGGPAHQAGLRGGTRMIPLNDTVYVVGGDLIVALNGKELRAPQDLTTLLLGSRPGDRVQMDVIRREERLTVSVVLPPMHF